MNVIIGARRSGKTYRLVNLLKADPRAVLITFCVAEANRIVEDYDPNGVFNLKSRVICMQDREALRRMDISARYIDNIDLVLETMFGPIKQATMSA